jgi:regulator of protease activity HflC (stomatin/prohibitin superfamily)
MLGLGLGGILVLVLSVVYTGLYRIEEGYVGVSYRGGKLLTDLAEPGYHVKLPLLTTVDQVQVTLQTDAVKNIPCGTSGGVMIYFDKVEVVNVLRKEAVYEMVRDYTVDYDKLWIFDRVHHEINQFCSSHTLQQVYIDMFDQLDEALVQALNAAISKWAKGLEIQSIRVTKPRIPDTILHNYEAVESERTKYTLAVQKQHVAEREAQNARERAKIEAQKELDVSLIVGAQKVNEKNGLLETQLIENEMHISHQKATADAQFYVDSKHAEANNARLTPEYLKKQMFQAMMKDTKLVFGDKIPNMAFGRTPVE